MDNVGLPIPVFQYKQWPVTIKVKNKMSSRRPQMKNLPQHPDFINIIKGIFVPIIKKPQFLICRVSVPNILNPVYCPIDSHIKYGTELVIITWVVSLRYRGLKHTLIEKSETGFPKSHRIHAQVFIQYNQVDRNKFLIGSPRWAMIFQRVHESFNTNT